MPIYNPYFAALQGPAQSATFNKIAKGVLADIVNKSGGDQPMGVLAAGSYDINMDEVANCLIHTNRKVEVTTKAIVVVGGTGGAKISLDIVEGGTTLGRAGEKTVATGDVVTLTGFETEDFAVIGNHIFKPQLTVIQVTSGSPSFTVAGTYPGHLRFLVKDIGALA